MLRTPRYRGGLARLWNMGLFAAQLLRRCSARGVPKPHLVVGSTVHLLAAWAASRLARRYRVPFVFEIRDIWPETLIDLGKLRPGSVVARLMARFSRHLCAKADLVISPLPGVRAYLDGLGCGQIPFLWVSNGVDTPETIVESAPTDNEEFVLMYLGSHGNANGLPGLLAAFDQAVCEIGDSRGLRLRLVGDGTQKSSLQAYAATLQSADRIDFEDRIPRSEVLTRAREADALVVNIENLPVYRFGISLNKIFDYLAAERPTIIATSAMNNPVAEAGAGLTVPAGDVRALAGAIREMSELPSARRAEMGLRGSEHVRQEYTFEVLAARLADAFDDTLALQEGRKPWR